MYHIKIHLKGITSGRISIDDGKLYKLSDYMCG